MARVKKVKGGFEIQQTTDPLTGTPYPVETLRCMREAIRALVSASSHARREEVPDWLRKDMDTVIRMVQTQTLAVEATR